MSLGKISIELDYKESFELRVLLSVARSTIEEAMELRPTDDKTILTSQRYGLSLCESISYRVRQALEESGIIEKAACPACGQECEIDPVTDVLTWHQSRPRTECDGALRSVEEVATQRASQALEHYWSREGHVQFAGVPFTQADIEFLRILKVKT